MENDENTQVHGPIVLAAERIVRRALWPSWLIVGRPPEPAMSERKRAEAERRIRNLDTYVIFCCVFELWALWLANSRMAIGYVVPWAIVGIIVLQCGRIVLTKARETFGVGAPTAKSGVSRNCLYFISHRFIPFAIVTLIAAGLSQTAFGKYITIPWLLVALLGVRGTEILAYAIKGSMLRHVHRWRRIRGPQSSTQRVVCLGVINWFEVLVIFACIYSLFPNDIHRPFGQAHSIVESLYLSVATQLTIGFGDVSPLNDLRIVACVQGIIGLLVIVANVSYYLGQLRFARDDWQEEKDAVSGLACAVNVCRRITREMPEDQVVCILAYGSAVFGQAQSDLSDVDVTVVLREARAEDAKILNSCKRVYPLLDLTLQYRSDINFDAPEDYQFGNHGAFYAKVFASARTLYGDNIFVGLADRISEEGYRDSLKRQAREHLWRIQQCEAQHGSDSKVFCEYARKYILRVMQNLYFMKMGIDYELFKGKSWTQWVGIVGGVGAFTVETMRLCEQAYAREDVPQELWSELLRSVYRDSRTSLA